jgi:hypothetical protein
MSTVLGGSQGSGNPGGNPDPNAGGNPGGAGAGGAAGGSGAAGSGAGGGQAQPSWRDTLPDDLKNNPALQTFSDVTNLAKSYVSAQQTIGKKGVIVPGEKATEEDWSTFYKGIGVPDLEKFHVEQPKDTPIDGERLTKFKEMAHASGLLPRQAQALLSKYTAYEKELVDGQVKQIEEAQGRQIAALKKEWGDGWDKQVSYANYVVKEIGGEDFAKYISKTGIGNDVNFIKIFAKLGEMLGGEKALAGAGATKFGNTPQEIQTEIDTIMHDPNNPYFDRAHSGHAAAVQKMESLYKNLYNSKNRAG